MRPEIRVFQTPEELGQEAAAEILRLADAAVKEKGFFTWALSGGATPRGVYSKLAGRAADVQAIPSGYPARFPWSKVHFFWGDERHVPPDHSDSNFGMAKSAMLDHVSIPPENIHRIHAEHADAAEAAADYEQSLRDFFHLEPGQWPTFDLILLGLGPDGHTASIFPGTDAIHERSRLVAAPMVPKLKARRITLTFATINQAATILFLVSGGEKADILHRVVEGEEDVEKYPAQGVKPLKGRLMWWADSAAASRLESIR